MDLLSGVDFLPVSIALFGFTEILLGAEQAEAARSRARIAIRDCFQRGKTGGRAVLPCCGAPVLGF
jgi:TctA family transporter